MTQDPMRTSKDCEDPGGAALVSAEWIVEDEDTTAILEELQRRRVNRERP
jgi:hypothetical protein